MASLAITSVTTEDSAPTSAPSRVSLNPGFKTATVVVGLTPSSGAFRALRLTLGATRATGPVLARRGCVCGLDKCGVPGTMPMRALSSASFVIDASQLPSGDGAKTVNVFGLHDVDGWL